jgi:hypothetical protein
MYAIEKPDVAHPKSDATVAYDPLRAASRLWRRQVTMVPLQQPKLLCSTLLGVTCHTPPHAEGMALPARGVNGAETGRQAASQGKANDSWLPVGDHCPADIDEGDRISPGFASRRCRAISW